MGTNQPWNWRLTVLKTIKMMLVKPPMTNFKMTVRADWAVSARSPFSPAIKTLPHWLSVAGVGLWTGVRPSPWLLASKIKQTLLSTKWPLYWLLSSEQLGPPLSVTLSRHWCWQVSIWATLIGVQRDLVVLICISLVSHGVEHLFMCLSATRISCLERSVQIFIPVVNGAVCFLIFEF